MGPGPDERATLHFSIKLHSLENFGSRSTSMSDAYPLSAHPNDGKSSYGGRDVVGYVGNPPPVRWPGGAKVALNLVLNYEEGAENCLLHGDGESEKLLSEIVGAGAIGEGVV